MGRSKSPFAARPPSPGRSLGSSRTPRSKSEGRTRTPRLMKPFVPQPRSPHVEFDAEAESGPEYPLPTWALQPLNNPEWCDDIKALFKYYATYGQTNPTGTEEGITRSNFWKLVREARMVDANINSTNTDIVFQECFPRHKRSNGRQKMLYAQFLLALAVISQRKYGQADPVGGLLQLVHEHLLPTAYEVQQSFRSASVAMAPPPCDVETSRLFDEMNDTLKAIFEHYTRVRAVQKGGQAGMLVKELHKVAEDLGIVPKMLSYSEVTQLAKASMSSRGGEQLIKFETWLDWLYRAATHGFSKPPFGRLYVSSAEKVEKLFEMIDRSQVWVKAKVSRKGTKHKSPFAKQRQASAIEAGAAIEKMAHADRAELVATITHELASQDLTGLVESTFEFYCTAAETSSVDSMKSFMFYKFVRDCKLLEITRHERVDLIFIRCVGSPDKPTNTTKLRMQYDQFILALVEIAQVAVPNVSEPVDACLELIVNNVLTNARRIEKFESRLTGRMEVQEVLAENQDLIDAVFGYYHDLDLEDGRCKLSSNRPELSLDGFIRLAKELGLCAHVASHQELCVLFRLCRDESEQLDKSQFCELLSRCAILWCDVDEHSESSELVACVSTFLDKLRDADGMRAVETWKCRTQTTRGGLLKSPHTPRARVRQQLPPVPFAFGEFGGSPFGAPPASSPLKSLGDQTLTPMATTSLLCPSWAIELCNAPEHLANLQRVYDHYRLINTPHDDNLTIQPSVHHDNLTCSKLYRLLRELGLIEAHAELPEVDRIFGRILGCNFHRYSEISFEAFKTALANLAGDPRSLASVLLNPLTSLVSQLPPPNQNASPVARAQLGSPGISADESDNILNGLFCHYATRTTYITSEELWSNLNQVRLAPMSDARMSMRQLSMLATELHLVPHLLSKDIALGKIAKTSFAGQALSLADFQAWISQCSQELFGDDERATARLLGQMSASGQFEKISEAWAHADHNVGHELIENFGPYDPLCDVRVSHANIGGSSVLLRQFLNHLGHSGREKDLRQVFRYYCSLAEDWPTDMLTLQKFIKLASDACLIDATLPHQMITRVYQHATGTKLYSMRWDDFLVAIIELVLLKFGSAPDNLATLADAVDGLVLAYCHQRPIQLSASDSDAYMRPEVMDALLEHDKLLQDLFWYYSAPDEFSNSRMMSQEQMLEMVLHFELVSSWTTENDLVAMFHLSHEAEPDTGLVYTQFIEFICRLCSHGGRAEAPVETKINSVLSHLDANPACFQIRRPNSVSKSQSGRGIRNGSPRAATPAQVKTPRAKTPRGRNSRGGMVEYDEVVDEVNTSRLRNNEEVAHTLNMLCQEDADTVRAVFDFYCSYAESQLQTTMKRSNLYKLVRDAQIQGESVNTNTLGVIIAKCQRVGCASSRIDLTTFYAMMAEVALRIYVDENDSMEQFLDEYLKPLSSRIVKAPVGPDLSEQSEEIADLFKECRDNISTLFDHYASLAPPSANQRSGSWKRVESMNSTVSLKETTKFAEDFNIVPALLSKMEVGRLMRVVTGNQDLALDLDRFVEWLGRAALHGFSRSEYTEEYPNDVAKVEKLLTMLDNSQVLHAIKQSRGKRHVPAFSRRHNEAVQRSAQERGATVRKSRRDIEQRLLQLLLNKGMHDDFRRIFEFYSSFGEDSVKDSMKAFMFYKMVRDCSMLDNLLSYERVDLIFAESVGKADKGPKGRKRLSYNQFVLAVSSLAKTKFPQLDTFDAFLRLCEEYVIPLARRADEAPPEFGTFQHSSIQDMLESKGSIISLVFNYYAKLNKSASGASQRTISFKGFSKFSKDFGITSCIASHQELAKMFQSAVDAHEEATVESWKEILTRCAMHWGHLTVGSSSPAEIVDRLAKFVRIMENSEAMISVEQWKSRTQTYKSALYKTYN